eukprot:TRINITY_DN8579_c0_g1_i1.p1 TRINITY_DN8579_c0_g1~~TRINITY_DN8579_c0_g1_i1.p1  ORF type:complete len:292 (+),score=59.25 TRINITY_DN8579_c0_g1_i1:65-940(+)
MDDKNFFKVARLLMDKKRANALRHADIGNIIDEGAPRPTSKTNIAERKIDKTSEDRRDECVTSSDLSMDLLPGACPASEITSDAGLNSDFDEAREDWGCEHTRCSDFSMNRVSSSEDHGDERATCSDPNIAMLRSACPASEITSKAALNSDFDEAGEYQGDEGVSCSDLGMNKLPGSEDRKDERAMCFDFRKHSSPGAEEIISDVRVHAGVSFTHASSSCRAVITSGDVASRSNPLRMMSRGGGRRLGLYDTPHPRLYLNEVRTDDDEEDDSLAPSFCDESDSASLPPSFS